MGLQGDEEGEENENEMDYSDDAFDMKDNDFEGETKEKENTESVYI